MNLYTDGVLCLSPLHSAFSITFRMMMQISCLLPVEIMQVGNATILHNIYLYFAQCLCHHMAITTVMLTLAFHVKDMLRKLKPCSKCLVMVTVIAGQGVNYEV